MDVFSREQFEDLLEHILQKIKRLLFSGAKHACGRVLCRVRGVRPSETTQLRVGCQRGGGVAGHFNFRNDSDMQRLSVRNDFTHVLLSITTAVTAIRTIRMTALRVQVETNPLSPGTDLGKPIFFDFDSPALIISKMPMKGVQLV